QQDLQQAQFAKDVQDSFAKQLNAYRQSKGVSQMVWNQDIADFESDRAESIANGTRSTDSIKSIHEGSKTGIALVMAKQGKMVFSGENETGYVIQSSDLSADDIAQALLNRWIQSTGHNANQLNPDYQEFGFGLAYGKLEGYPVVYAYTGFAAPFNQQETHGEIDKFGTYQDVVDEFAKYNASPLSNEALAQYHAEPHVETFDDIKANADA
ncbi:CAP domain-containing protein, partial [Fructobacillus tropaeoli]